MTRPIVIFDSGVGGFSILKELLHVNVPLVYLGDQAAFPYGERDETWLHLRLTQLAAWINQLDPQLVVMACNTATVGGINLFRGIVSCPVVGVEPVVKPAANYKKALILGTHHTVASRRMQDLMSSNKGVISAYTPTGLPQAVEDINIEQVKNIILKLKKIVQKQKIEALGLSCTHYPLVKDFIHKLIPEVAIIDPSEAVAEHVKSKINLENSSQSPSVIFYTTADVLRFKYQVKYYLGLEAQPQYINL